MKIKLIIPYFGKLPGYFEFFLKSCEINTEIEYLIFTDQEKLPKCPPNVVVLHLTFAEFKQLAQKKLSLNERSMKALAPYKLCDYKPTYGILFEDYLKDADFWGFCDVDLVFGKIFDMLSLEEVSHSERILTQGHLTMYKNCERMNRLFEEDVEGGINFRKAIEIKEPCFFDEIFMPFICKRKNVIQYGQNIFADILPQYGNFAIAPLCAIENQEKQSFYWENGKLYREYAGKQDELMYIHLQKRPLPYTNGLVNHAGKIYITPQGFFTEDNYTEGCERPDETQVQKYQKKRWLALTPRKVWIKLKVRKFKEQLK